MILERFTVGPFAENCYLIGKAPRVAIVDPGAESAWGVGPGHSTSLALPRPTGGHRR